jgi:hypothetical protein
MRTPLHAMRAIIVERLHTLIARSLKRGSMTLCGGLLVVILTLPAGALADSMSLSVAPEAVQELTGQVTYVTSSEEATYPVVYANNPGVPCAANPQGDTGQMLTVTHFAEGGNIGQASGAVNWTPPSTGAYTLCGWTTIPAGLLEMEGGPVTATSQLPVVVRAPRVSLALSFPRPAVAGEGFTIDLDASSEVKREVVVQGVPYTRAGCPIDPAAGAAQNLIETEVTGGPWLSRATVKALSGGRWIFCAWADPPEDHGLYPQASTSLLLNLSGHPKAKRKRRRAALERRPATPTEFVAIDRYFSATERTLHVKLAWVNVSTVGPYALAYLRGGQTTVAVLRGSGAHWISLATISDEGLRCGLVPPAIVSGLEMERYNEGPKPCS